MAQKGTGLCGQRCTKVNGEHREIAKGSADLANAAEPVRNEPECAVPDDAAPERLHDAVGEENPYSCPACALKAGLLLTPAQWEQRENVRVVDDDGWRTPGSPTWETPITRADFQRRLGASTSQGFDWDLGQPIVRRPSGGSGIVW
jgi:hypothetical protein